MALAHSGRAPDGPEGAGGSLRTRWDGLWSGSVGTVALRVLLECRKVRDVGEVRWQELTKQECFGLLAGQQLGRVVLVDDRGPLLGVVVDEDVGDHWRHSR
jgi:hypothetical protein